MDIKLLLLGILTVESLAGSTLVFWVKGEKSLNVKLISFFLLTLGLIFLQSLVSNMFGEMNPHPLIVLFSYLFFVLCLLLPPTFYWYTLSLVRDDKKLLIDRNVLGHYLPAVGLFVINIFSFVALYVIPVESEKYTLLRTTLEYVNFISLLFVFLVQNVFYLLYAWRLYYSEKIILKESQNKETNLTIKWMKSFILLYTILIILLYLSIPITELKFLFRIFTVVYVSLIIYFGRNNYKFVLENIKSETLDETKRSEIKKRLMTFIESDQPYLDQNLTVISLAHSINTNSKYLSYLINKEFDCNFSSFINKYRIEKAKKLLSNSENDIYTIESISSMTGFKSKSTFNATFKKETQLTPSQFKINARKNSII